MSTYIVLRCKICSFIYYSNGMYVCFLSMIDRLPQQLWQRNHPRRSSSAGDTAHNGADRGRARRWRYRTRRRFSGPCPATTDRARDGFFSEPCLELVLPHATVFFGVVPGAGDTARDGADRGRVRLPGMSDCPAGHANVAAVLEAAQRSALAAPPDGRR